MNSLARRKGTVCLASHLTTDTHWLSLELGVSSAENFWNEFELTSGEDHDDS